MREELQLHYSAGCNLNYINQNAILYQPETSVPVRQLGTLNCCIIPVRTGWYILADTLW